MLRMLPKVSVCVITYNHEAHIRQCLDNIISQKVNFEFEIIIGEDKSTDRTGEIVLEYQQKYPNLITVVSPPQNQGLWANVDRAFRACTGEYLTVIDGDDYWTSNEKLQKQVNFLDGHTEYAMCFHRVEIKNEGVDRNLGIESFADGMEFSIRDVILKNWFIVGLGLMIRRVALPPLPAWTKDILSLDIAIQLMVATTGNIGYISETFGVYRLHANGISVINWEGKINEDLFAHIELFKRFNEFTEGKYWPIVKIRLHRHYRELMQVNKVTSKVYIHAVRSIYALGPDVYVPMIKHWIVVHLVPVALYKIYKGEKLQNANLG